MPICLIESPCVTTDLNKAIFHQKFMVRDPRGPTAAVLTGSTN